MKKIIIAVTMIVWYNSSMACMTTTVASGDKIVTCTVCPTSTVCI